MVVTDRGISAAASSGLLPARATSSMFKSRERSVGLVTLVVERGPRRPALAARFELLPRHSLVVVVGCDQ
jgi:hypothetical protein